jgi:hypothetical protein
LPVDCTIRLPTTTPYQSSWRSAARGVAFCEWSISRTWARYGRSVAAGATARKSAAGTSTSWHSSLVFWIGSSVRPCGPNVPAGGPSRSPTVMVRGSGAGAAAESSRRRIASQGVTFVCPRAGGAPAIVRSHGSDACVSTTWGMYSAYAPTPPGGGYCEWTTVGSSVKRGPATVNE